LQVVQFVPEQLHFPIVNTISPYEIALSTMKRGPSGYHIPISSLGESCRAFVPHPLPPDPALLLDDELQTLAQRAAAALGRLDGISSLLPNPQLFLYSYIRKEAVLSSQIEGTQSSLSDLLLFEAEGSPGVPVDDVREVSNYVAAMERGIELLQGGLPLSLRLIREIHGILLRDGRGSNKEPGEFRSSQNWIGGTRPGNALYVPPPPDALLECMGALETFLHSDRTHVLIRAALAHVQFETIHPFLDGNGRLGRLLITFLFHADGVLRHPLLYLSLYFKQHRARYYELLQSVRTEGDWEAWLVFFLEGVEAVSAEAVETARRLLALSGEHQARIQDLGRTTGSAMRVLDHLQRHPITSAPAVVEATGMSFHTANKMFSTLESLGLVRETTGKKYGRLYSYSPYLEILSEGTEPLGNAEPGTRKQT
jgi:Fic family protein